MSYADAKYGLRRRVIFPNVDDISSSAVHPDEISFPTKTKIFKFGLIAQDNDVRVSSDTVLDLIIAGPTASTLAQFTFTTAAVVAATDHQTGHTITATTVAANTPLQGAVGVLGSSGNFQYFIDVQEQFDANASR